MRTPSILSAIICAASVLMPVMAYADEVKQRLVVWQKSGEKVYFDLAEEPRTSFSGGLLIIKTNTVETSYQRSNIVRFTYEGVHTGVVSEAATRELTVTQTDNGITLKNVKKGTIVRMYDPAGGLIDTRTSNGTSPIQFSLTGRPAGVYLVNMNDQTFKILKR